MSNVLNFGIPKGSLEDATVGLFKKSGWQISISSRSYFPGVDDSEMNCKLIRPQEMARYVERGTIDAGIAGRDWVRENDSDVVEVCEMVYSKVSRRPARWVLVVNGDSTVQKPEDLHGATISTELVGFTKRYFAERNIPVNVEFSWGATEAKAAEGLVDAVVEITETGSTIRAHGLRIVCDLLYTHTRLIANRAALTDPWKRAKIEQIALLLQAALKARHKVVLKMNAPVNRLEDLMSILPSLHAPTVNPLYDPDWCAVETVVDRRLVRDLIPRLATAGAEGILEYALQKVV